MNKINIYFTFNSNNDCGEMAMIADNWSYVLDEIEFFVENWF